MPIPVAPRANFTGVEGARSPSLVHISAQSGASTMTQKGRMEFGQLTGNSQPNRFRSRRVSEYSVTTVNCCWNSDQNTTLPSHIGMNARTRLRSSPSTFGLVSMIAKIPFEISTTTIATAVERFAAVRMPVAKPTTTSTTTTTTPRAGRSQAPAGSGSGTTAALEGRPRRPRA